MHPRSPVGRVTATVMITDHRSTEAPRRADPEGLPIHYRPQGRSRRFWWGCVGVAVALHAIGLGSLRGAGSLGGTQAGALMPIARVVLPAAETGATGAVPGAIVPSNTGNPSGTPANQALANPAATTQPLRPLPLLRQLDPGQLSGPGAIAGDRAAMPRWPAADSGASAPVQPFNPDPIDPNAPPDYLTPGYSPPPPAPNRPIGPSGNGDGSSGNSGNPNNSGSPGNFGNPTTPPNGGQPSAGSGSLALSVVGLELTTPGDGGPIIQPGDLSRSPQLQSTPPSLNLSQYPELAGWAGRAVDLRLAVMADGSVGFAGVLTPGLGAAAEQALQTRAAQLRFLPALTTAGQPIAVYLRLTIRLTAGNQ